MIIRDIPTFDYFSPMVPTFEGKRILDFGCNKGNFLKSSGGEIQQSQYTGIDVDREAVDHAKTLYPDAMWLHYNRKNPLYHPEGDDSLPSFEHQFDLIISYSVFTHMDIDDTMDVLQLLYKHLSPGGSIYFTYCNINRPVCIDYFIDRRKRKYGHCDPLFTNSYLYLINEYVSMTPPSEKCDRFVSFYDEGWLLEKLREFNPISIEPTKKWNQECMRIEWFQDCVHCRR